MGQAQHWLELVQCNVMFRPDLTNFVPVLLGITKTFYFQQVFLAGEDETYVSLSRIWFRGREERVQKENAIRGLPFG